MSRTEGPSSDPLLRRGRWRFRGTLLAVALIGIVVPIRAGALADTDFPEGRTVAAMTSRVSARFDETLARNWVQMSSREVDCEHQLGDPCHLEHWRAEIATLDLLPEQGQVARLNRWINQVPFRSDAENWGRDYWAAPGEFFARGGDCEDYAIAKYAALRRLGVAAERLRIVVLADELRGVVHAGLVLRQSGGDWFLDNLIGEPQRWSETRHYRPIYSLNEAGAWLHLKDGKELRTLLSSLRPAAAR